MVDKNHLHLPSSAPISKGDQDIHDDSRLAGQMAITPPDSLSSSASFPACGSTLKVICRFKTPPFSQTPTSTCGPKEEHTSKPNCGGNYSTRVITTSEHFGITYGAGHSTIREVEQWMPHGKRRKLGHHQEGGGCGTSSSSSSSSSSEARNEIISTPTQTPSQSTGREPPTATEVKAHEQHLTALETLTRQREALLNRFLQVQQRDLTSVENHLRDLISLYRRKKAEFKDLRRIQGASSNPPSSEYKSLKSTLISLWDGQALYMKTRMQTLKAIESTERRLRIVRNRGQIVELKTEIDLLVAWIGEPTVGSDGELANPLDALD